MKRTLTRLATLALAAPLSVALATAPAQADSTYSVPVPGCFGAGPQIVCDPTVTVQVPDVTFPVQYVQVCVGDCHDVPVTTVSNSGTTSVCVSYTRQGSTTPTRTCTNKLLAIDDQLESYVLNALTCSAEELVCVHE